MTQRSAFDPAHPGAAYDEFMATVAPSGMPYAHPSPEHFSPLLVALGAADDPAAPVVPAISGFWVGLSKGSFALA